ncbi:MAG: M28 family peptidase, partial [Myxococcota bacterium]
MRVWLRTTRQPGTVVAVLAALVACGTPMPPPHPPPRAALAEPDEPLLSRVHQLTFAGRRSGEGYFSRDGGMLIFQSERQAENPFYQIYLMNLAQGDVRRLSPGVGKATCAWIHPSGGQVLFASTHLDPEARSKQLRELEERASGRERRYAWDFDERFDLFAMDLEGEPLRLTTARGYDAEASWSPDGRSIVFASNRHAYTAELSPAERERFEVDRSTFVDLYSMDARGGSVRRLTDSPGYDGGPFFSPDGGRIVWRRFNEAGDRAEIFSMRSDGSDVHQLTRLGAMSWAPFYHPSGDYIVFSANLQGLGNFELYAVDVEGRSTPVRVTASDGFDSLPAFAPDGRTLAWTSQRGGGRRSQLFLADWDDALARRRLGLPAQRESVVLPLLVLPERTSPEIEANDLRAHVRALSSEAADGRLTGSAGERIATSYVARAFRRVGLEPAGDDGTYFQEFTFTAGVSLGDDNQLTFEGARKDSSAFVVDRDWRPLAFSKVGQIETSEVVFAGYGIVAPAGEEGAGIDAYAEIDVKDRWVLVFRYAPTGISAAGRRHLRRYTSLRYKAMLARERGARGILVVSGPSSKVRRELVPLAFDASLSGSSVAALSITDALAERLLRGSGRKLAALQATLDAGGDFAAFSLPGVRLAATIALRQLRSRGRNVIGRLSAGGENDAAASVVIGAHVDHLGRGKVSGSLAREEEEHRIHYGADDNASGVAALIEMAEHLVHRQAHGRLEMKRDLLFAAWSGEELGLLGSSHFSRERIATQARPNPHSLSEGLVEAEKAGVEREIAAYLNLDMVGRLEDQLLLFGVGSSSIWPSEIERR